MPAEWKIGVGDPDPRPTVARIAAGGAQEYPVEAHRESKPPVESVDVEGIPVPAREQAKADGTFGVELPYVQRWRA